MQRSPARFAASAPLASRAGTSALLGQVLGITGVGFLVTALGAYVALPISRGVSLVALLVGFGLLIASGRSAAHPQRSLALFYAFTFCEGVGLAPLIASYVGRFGPGIVVDAASTTGLGMLVLGGVAALGGIDWRRFSGAAFGMLIGLMIAGVVSAFTHFLHPGTYAWATLAVFTLLTLIDFARIRAGGDGLGPVQLATSIYLDGINIFMAVLQIMGLRRSDD